MKMVTYRDVTQLKIVFFDAMMGFAIWHRERIISVIADVKGVNYLKREKGGRKNFFFTDTSLVFFLQISLETFLQKER